MKAKSVNQLQGQSTLLRAPRYVERSITVAAILSIAGVVVVAVGIYVEGVIGTFIASIGGILITVAILSVLYDAYLKDVLIREIYDALEIQQSLQAIDLREIVRKDQVDLSQVLLDAKEVTVIPLDPITWAHHDWDRLAAHAARTAIPVDVYLPSHDSPHIDVLAQRLGLPKPELARQIARLPDQLAASWDQKRAGGQGSTLQVNLYGAVPAVGILATSRRTLLELPPSLGYAMADRSCLVMVLGEEGWSSLVEEFVEDQFEEDRIPAHSRSVMRPLDGSTSPDAAVGSPGGLRPGMRESEDDRQ